MNHYYKKSHNEPNPPTVEQDASPSKTGNIWRVPSFYRAFRNPFLTATTRCWETSPYSARKNEEPNPICRKMVRTK